MRVGSGCVRFARDGCRGGQPSKNKRAAGTGAVRRPEAGAAGPEDALSEVIAQEVHAQMPIVVGVIEDRKKYDLELNEVPIRIHPACAAHRDTPDSCCKQARSLSVTDEFLLLVAMPHGLQQVLFMNMAHTVSSKLP